MGKIKGLTLGQGRFKVRPHGLLARIGLKVLDDRPPLGRFDGREKRLTGDEAFIFGFLPVKFPFTDNDLDPVVPHIQGLSPALDPVADHSHDFVFEYRPGFVKCKFVRGNHLFHDATDVDL